MSITRWTRERSWLIRLRKLRRWGWCPRCNSSPPDPTCPVCDGATRYGRELNLDERLLWERRWCLERTDYVRMDRADYLARPRGPR